MKYSVKLMVYMWCPIVALVVDRVSKMAAVYCAHIGALPVRLCSVVSCDLVFNRGVSWGMLHDDGALFFNVIIIITMLVTGMIAWQWYNMIIVGNMVYGELLIVIGALSNIIDRLWYGGVVDFIVISFYNVPLFVCNIADIYITVGVLFFLFDVRRLLHE